uniref:hypothetical protein n=1 Tax=Vibrio harveyi TaxID=669 RepID=UPI00068033A1|nr:hypothetical protein [Vibrio harveyi]
MELEWWQPFFVTIATVVITKLVDHVIAISKEKRELSKARKSKKIDQIENLMDELSVYFEVAMSWKPYSEKACHYEKLFSDDDALIGKYNRYKNIVSHGREVLHYCKIIASEESPNTPLKVDNTKELKDVLSKKYHEFITVCEQEIKTTA